VDVTDNYVPAAANAQNAEPVLVTHVPVANPDVKEHFVQTVMNVSNAVIVNANHVQAANPAVREENVPNAVNAQYAANASAAMKLDVMDLFARTAEVAARIAMRKDHASVVRSAPAMVQAVVVITVRATMIATMIARADAPV